MQNSHLVKAAIQFLDRQRFIAVPTANARNEPHASIKMVLFATDAYVVLMDYILGTTYENLSRNPYVSFSAYDTEALKGYHIYGEVAIIHGDAKDFKRFVRIWDDQHVHLIADKVIERLREGRVSDEMRIALVEPTVFYKVNLQEIEEIQAVQR
ncbi:MAG: hypothetical protein GF333_00885 [Candidatus Omnitrophica bacterium]|nr:hypothetical protein [Candidatus Omnitrophota bacterium]